MISICIKKRDADWAMRGNDVLFSLEIVGQLREAGVAVHGVLGITGVPAGYIEISSDADGDCYIDYHADCYPPEASVYHVVDSEDRDMREFSLRPMTQAVEKLKAKGAPLVGDLTIKGVERGSVLIYNDAAGDLVVAWRDAMVAAAKGSAS